MSASGFTVTIRLDAPGYDCFDVADVVARSLRTDASITNRQVRVGQLEVWRDDEA